MTSLRVLVPVTLLWCLCLTGVVPAGEGPQPPRGGSATADALAGRVQRAVQRLRSGTVWDLEVLYFPKEFLTWHALGPQDVERAALYRIGLRELDEDSKFVQELATALAAARFGQVKREGDLRWGCVFYDMKHARVLTMYFDGDGKTGLIDGVPVTGGQPVVKALERRCSGLWEGEYWLSKK